jgi:hypothetical protein
MGKYAEQLRTKYKRKDDSIVYMAGDTPVNLTPGLILAWAQGMVSA